MAFTGGKRIFGDFPDVVIDKGIGSGLPVMGFGLVRDSELHLGISGRSSEERVRRHDIRMPADSSDGQSDFDSSPRPGYRGLARYSLLRLEHGSTFCLTFRTGADWIEGVTEESRQMIDAAAALRDAVKDLQFNAPITHVYNPLDYAWDAHALYLRKWAAGPRRVIFLGMNPGPWGMAQTGVPFGEISLVRDWVGVEAAVRKPPVEHPKRPVEGFACRRSEVSGKRLWGLFAERFVDPDRFFSEHFVANYCPLVFMDEGGRNRTPDKLPVGEAGALREPCDAHLREIVRILQPEFLIGVGGYAGKRLREVFSGDGIRVESILHPSPASPAANRGWAKAADAALRGMGVWN